MSKLDTTCSSSPKKSTPGPEIHDKVDDRTVYQELGQLSGPPCYDRVCVDK